MSTLDREAAQLAIDNAEGLVKVYAIGHVAKLRDHLIAALAELEGHTVYVCEHCHCVCPHCSPPHIRHGLRPVKLPGKTETWRIEYMSPEKFVTATGDTPEEAIANFNKEYNA